MDTRDIISSCSIVGVAGVMSAGLDRLLQCDLLNQFPGFGFGFLALTIYKPHSVCSRPHMSPAYHDTVICDMDWPQACLSS